MIKLRHILSMILTLGATLFLSGCNMAVLNPKGMIAADEKQLLIDAVLLMLIIVLPVILLTLIIARRYRASNTKAKYSPNWAHGTLLEAGWWLIPCVIIGVLATMTWRSTHRLDPYRPLELPAQTENSAVVQTQPITIEVIALQWRWLFIYPEQNIATIDFVEFPANTPVTFLLTGDAPMNSFQIPQLAGQIYAMAGMETKLHLIANEPGDYNGRSTNFSGDGFSNMTFVARATTQEAFDQWVQSVKQSPNQLTIESYKQLSAPSEDHSVQYYSSVASNLFKKVIMKYMMPDPEMQNTEDNSTVVSAK